MQNILTAGLGLFNKTMFIFLNNLNFKRVFRGFQSLLSIRHIKCNKPWDNSGLFIRDIFFYIFVAMSCVFQLSRIYTTAVVWAYLNITLVTQYVCNVENYYSVTDKVCRLFRVGGCWRENVKVVPCCAVYLPCELVRKKNWRLSPRWRDFPTVKYRFFFKTKVPADSQIILKAISSFLLVLYRFRTVYV